MNFFRVINEMDQKSRTILGETATNTRLEFINAYEEIQQVMCDSPGTVGMG